MKLSIILLFLAFSTADATANFRKKVYAREGKKCVGKADKITKLGQANKGDLQLCKNKCERDDDCVAVQFDGRRTCSLYYSAIEKVSS